MMVSTVTSTKMGFSNNSVIYSRYQFVLISRGDGYLIGIPPSKVSFFF